jgi:hypothetical protein
VSAEPGLGHASQAHRELNEARPWQRRPGADGARHPPAAPHCVWRSVVAGLDASAGLSVASLLLGLQLTARCSPPGRAGSATTDTARIPTRAHSRSGRAKRRSTSVCTRSPGRTGFATSRWITASARGFAGRQARPSATLAGGPWRLRGRLHRRALLGGGHDLNSKRACHFRHPDRLISMRGHLAPSGA